MAEQTATFDQHVKAIDELAGFMGNFVSGLVDELRTTQKDAAAILAKYQARYAAGIAAATAARNLAIAAADPVMEAAWRATANSLSETALTLADSVKPATERIALHDAWITSKFAAFGRYVGPAFDTYKVWDAINSGDGEKSSEAALSIALGAIGGIVGAAVGSSLPGPGTVLVAAFFSALFAGTAEKVNGYVFPWVQKLGALLPDGFWRGIDAVAYGPGSARLEPTAAGLANLLLARMDATAVTQSEYAFFDAASSSNTGRETIALLNHLGRVFIPGIAPLAEAATAEQIRAFGTSIAAVSDQFAGSLRIRVGVPSSDDAKQNFTAFLGMYALSPLVISSSEGATQVALDAALGERWANEYNLWLADRSAEASGAAPSSLNFTDEYLKARGEMLTWLQVFNKLDVAYDQRLTTLGGLFPLPVQGDFIYQDEASGISLDIDGVNLTEADSHYVRFGGEASDFLVGGMLSDRLFGGGGRDILSGFRGDDYLEGNGGDDTLYGNAGSDMLLGGEGGDTLDGGEDADVLYGGAGADTLNGGTGSDILYGDFGADDPDAPPTLMAASATSGSGSDDRLNGGEGADTLHGGAGNDILDGGEGNDTLTGGAGLDVYTVEADSGRDTVIDSDGRGRIWLAGREILGGGELQAETDASAVWVDDSDEGHPITYRLNRNTNELSITGHGSTVLVRDYETGDLGINVPAAPPAPDPVALSHTFDISKVIVLPDVFFEDGSGVVRPTFVWDVSHIDPHLRVVDGGFDPDGSPSQHDYAQEAVHIRNAAIAVDYNPATGHHSSVSGLRADDLIEGGPGVSQHRVAIWGSDGNDRMFARTETSLQAAVAGGESGEASGTGWLRLDGGTGDDLLVGDTGDDMLSGGAGDDIIAGGAGSDLIVADMGGVPALTSGTLDSSVHTPWFTALSDPDVVPVLAEVLLHTDRQSYYTVGGSLIHYNRYVSLAGTSAFAAVDLSGLYAMQRGDVPAVPGGLPDSRRTYADLNGLGWTGYGGPQDGPAGGPDGGGNDIIYAGAGNDTVNAGGGDDTVFAGSGIDLVAGYDGEDFVEGGDGGDRLFGDYLSMSTIDGGPAIETFEVYGAQIVIRNTLDAGRHGADHLDGGAGDDTVLGNGAADQVFGGAGDDQLFGDEDKAMGQYSGDDHVDGQEGNDMVTGGGGSDQLLGGDGDDALLGDWADDGVQYSGQDHLDGGAGNDELSGGGNDDRLLGGQGNDALWGDATDLEEANTTSYGSDVLDGGEGDDTLQGDGGADVLIGGTGNDTLFGDDDESNLALAHHGADRLDGGDGNDYLDGEGGDDQLEGGEGSDELRGGKGNDSLLGGAGSDALLGGDGDDVVDGGAGNDSLADGAGNDVYLFGRGDGQDMLAGGLGEIVGGVNTLRFRAGVGPADLLVSRFGANLLLQLSGSTDQVLVGGFFSGDNPAGSANPLQRIEFADGTVWGLGQIVAMTTTGGGDDDDLRGTVLDDVLLGNAGSDRLFGLEGNDLYVGGTGNDEMRDAGETGNDTYRFELGAGFDIVDDMGGNDRIEFGAGIAPDALRVQMGYDGILALMASDTDRVIVSGFEASSHALIPERAIETVAFADGTVWDLARIMSEALRATAGDDEIYAFGGDDEVAGGDGDDRLFGMAGRDTLLGGAGSDSLNGGGDADVLEGGAGDDSLGGLSGADVLAGGTGDDWLDGGGGDDVYRFGIGDGADTIYEGFEVYGGMDRIEFGAGISVADLQTVRNIDGDLWLTLGTGDSILVRDMFAGHTAETAGAISPVYGIESIAFADGVTWDAAAIKAEALRQALVATDGADTSYLTDAGDSMDGGGGNDTLHGLGGADLLMGGAGDDVLWGGSGNDSLQGGTGADVLDGEDGDDTLQGGDGADVLNAGFGNDVLDGGAGDDVLNGWVGNDVYRFGLGSGQDTIQAIARMEGRQSAVMFDAGVLPSDVVARRIPGSNDLELAIAASTDKLIVNGFFGEAENNPVQEIRFADGTTWDIERILQDVALPPDDPADDDPYAAQTIDLAQLDSDVALASLSYAWVTSEDRPGIATLRLFSDHQALLDLDYDAAIPENWRFAALNGIFRFELASGEFLFLQQLLNTVPVESPPEEDDPYAARTIDLVLLDADVSLASLSYAWIAPADRPEVATLRLFSDHQALLDLDYDAAVPENQRVISLNGMLRFELASGEFLFLQQLLNNAEVEPMPEADLTVAEMAADEAVLPTGVSAAAPAAEQSQFLRGSVFGYLLPQQAQQFTLAGAGTGDAVSALDNLLFGNSVANAIADRGGSDIHAAQAGSDTPANGGMAMAEPAPALESLSSRLRSLAQAGVRPWAGQTGLVPLDAWTALQGALQLTTPREAGLPALAETSPANDHLDVVALAAGERRPTWLHQQPMQMLR